MLVRLGAGFVAFSASLVLAQGPPELPPIPGDLSTPVQARLAFNGASGTCVAVCQPLVWSLANIL